jgi:hypothetical protein
MGTAPPLHVVVQLDRGHSPSHVHSIGVIRVLSHSYLQNLFHLLIPSSSLLHIPQSRRGEI